MYIMNGILNLMKKCWKLSFYLSLEQQQQWIHLNTKYHNEKTYGSVMWSFSRPEKCSTRSLLSCALAMWVFKVLLVLHCWLQMGQTWKLSRWVSMWCFIFVLSLLVLWQTLQLYITPSPGSPTILVIRLCISWSKLEIFLTKSRSIRCSKNHHKLLSSKQHLNMGCHYCG